MSTHLAGEICKVSLVPTQSCKSGSTCDAVMTETISRRGAMTGGVLAVVLAGVTDVFLFDGSIAEAKPADQPVAETIRWGLLVDVTRCVEGCSSCVDACREEHGWTGFGRPATDPQWIRKLSLTDRASGHTVSLPVMCQHCEYPPCVDVCPTGASFRRADGIVLVDRHICIGCRYCMMACPYNARSFVHETITNQKSHMPRGKGCVESCTLCAHRVDRDQQLACVKRCADIGNKALLFGDLNNPSSEIAQRLAAYSSIRIRQDLKTSPGIYYQGL